MLKLDRSKDVSKAKELFALLYPDSNVEEIFDKFIPLYKDGNDLVYDLYTLELDFGFDTVKNCGLYDWLNADIYPKYVKIVRGEGKSTFYMMITGVEQIPTIDHYKILYNYTSVGKRTIEVGSKMSFGKVLVPEEWDFEKSTEEEFLSNLTQVVKKIKYVDSLLFRKE